MYHFKNRWNVFGLVISIYPATHASHIQESEINSTQCSSSISSQIIMEEQSQERIAHPSPNRMNEHHNSSNDFINELKDLWKICIKDENVKKRLYPALFLGLEMLWEKTMKHKKYCKPVCIDKKSIPHKAVNTLAQILKNQPTEVPFILQKKIGNSNFFTSIKIFPQNIKKTASLQHAQKK
jgi:hypothetical protein